MNEPSLRRAETVLPTCAEDLRSLNIEAARSLLDAERCFNRVHGYRHLPLLQQALARPIDALTDE